MLTLNYTDRIYPDVNQQTELEDVTQVHLRSIAIAPISLAMCVCRL